MIESYSNQISEYIDLPNPLVSKLFCLLDFMAYQPLQVI